MMTPTFWVIGNATGCTLADLKVTGYTGNSVGKFRLRLLDEGGHYVDNKTYYWVHNSTKCGWYGNAGGTSAIDASKIGINAGRGVWCEVAADGYKLQSSGQVNESLVVYPANNGYTAMGNCTPVDLTLADFSVTGYTGNSVGKFRLRLLDEGGHYVDNKTYYWVHNSTKCGWYGNAGGTSAVDASKIAISAGRGLWCEVAADGYQLNIPAPVLSK